MNKETILEVNRNDLMKKLNKAFKVGDTFVSFNERYENSSKPEERVMRSDKITLWIIADFHKDGDILLKTLSVSRSHLDMGTEVEPAEISVGWEKIYRKTLRDNLKESQETADGAHIEVWTRLDMLSEDTMREIWNMFKQAEGNIEFELSKILFNMEVL